MRQARADVARTGKSFDALFRPLTKPPRRRLAAPPESNPVVQVIWDIIAMIPRGQVSTYGEVARAAGLPRGARQTAYALRMLPHGVHLPWHRVVGAGGRIVFPKSSRQFLEQSRRLRSEGVAVKDGRVPPSAFAVLRVL
jgi:methylated-DNA-protein-cysteine methyltransferase related protein